ncbi:hypothetical protein PBT90_09345 [Algoriphagus halophytocola]|uniref:hypothetical protein n=1 Tax=Algoriphagus halophytocola TaxID=2991499 RepID=UPI0022DD8235|nr:hypothetical protein [Algoriphagus sp. TR-M9]WBL44885.1 hypothetical protein PBT90_09345 [Algoriphagus sp. TR-M9]
MKQLLLILALGALLSCNPGDSTKNLPNSYTLEIKDSIQVDYLGKLNVFDYDPESGLYLGIDQNLNHVMLFKEQGGTDHQYDYKNDGPNAITKAISNSFLEGKHTIMDFQNGLIQYDQNGNISHKINIPSEYFLFNYSNFSAYKLGDKYAYIRPERDLSDYSNTSAFNQRIYKSPILEVFDPETGEIYNTMSIPPGTIYEDGNFYHKLFQNVKKSGEKWYLFFLAERKYYVYEEKGNELIYSKTIDLNITDAVDIIGVPIENPELINQQAEPNIFGKIEGLYPLSEHTVVIYTKGVKKEISNRYDPQKTEEWMGFINGIPRYAAILDKNDSLIQKDIQLPQGLLFNGVSNDNDEIIALKNQDYFGEEDKVTFYKLQIKN